MAKTLYLTFDLDEWPWPYNFTSQNVKPCEMHLYTKYQMSISIGSNVIAQTLYLTFDLDWWPWPWHITPQNVRLYEVHMHAKYQVSVCKGSKVMANVKVLWLKLYIWPLTLMNDLDLILLPSKCATSWDTLVHQISNVYLYWIKCYDQSENGLLTYIFDLWHWRMTLTLTN